MSLSKKILLLKREGFKICLFFISNGDNKDFLNSFLSNLCLEYDDAVYRLKCLLSNFTRFREKGDKKLHFFSEG